MFTVEGSAGRDFVGWNDAPIRTRRAKHGRDRPADGRCFPCAWRGLLTRSLPLVSCHWTARIKTDPLSAMGAETCYLGHELSIIQRVLEHKYIDRPLPVS